MFSKNVFSRQLFLAAVLAIPTHSLDGWTQLKFNKIVPNQVSTENGQLKIVVNSSASPLIYKLPKIETVQAFNFEISTEGQLPKEIDGEFGEDFSFRLGLVATGEKTLSRLQRLIAADWVKKLFDLSPSGVGLDKIYFYNLAQNKKSVGSVRPHPKTELMNEFIFANLTTENKYEYRLEKPLKVAAIWLSTDGDDSSASYTLNLKSLNLEVQQ